MIRIAFRYGDTRLFSRLVCFFRGGDAAHCEAAYNWNGTEYECISSSFLDGGVRKKVIDMAPDKWRIYELPGEALDLLNWYDRHASWKYDWLGLIGFIWRPIKGFMDRVFCSEACADMMGLPDPYLYDLCVLESVCKRYGARVN